VDRVPSPLTIEEAEADLSGIPLVPVMQATIA
jgi:hypothetical protein